MKITWNFMLLCFISYVGTAVVSEHICAYTNLYFAHAHLLTHTSTIHTHIQDLQTTHKSELGLWWLVWLTSMPQTTSASSCASTQVGRCCNQPPNHEAISLFAPTSCYLRICLLARYWSFGCMNRTFSFSFIIYAAVAL